MPGAAKRNAPAQTGAGALSWMAGRLIATILEKLEPAGAAADQVDDHALPGISVLDRLLELFRTRDLLMIYFRDHIAVLDSASRGRAVGFHIADHNPLGRFNSVLFGQVAGNGKTDARARTANQCVDADDLFFLLTPFWLLYSPAGL